MADAKPGAEYWTALGWHPSTEQLDQLATLQVLLREWNEKVNLTRLVEGDDYWINQVFDSLWPLAAELKTPHQTRTCIDVGTGGGFPGLAIAIALPGSQMTLLDSVGRKTAAVEAMASRRVACHTALRCGLGSGRVAPAVSTAPPLWRALAGPGSSGRSSRQAAGKWRLGVRRLMTRTPHDGHRKGSRSMRWRMIRKGQSSRKQWKNKDFHKITKN